MVPAAARRNSPAFRAAIGRDVPDRRLGRMVAGLDGGLEAGPIKNDGWQVLLSGPQVKNHGLETGYS